MSSADKRSAEAANFLLTDTLYIPSEREHSEPGIPLTYLINVKINELIITIFYNNFTKRLEQHLSVRPIAKNVKRKKTQSFF